MGAAHGGQVLVSQAVAALVLRPPAGRRVAARSRRGAAARPVQRRARVPGRARGAARGFPGAARARGDAEQPAAADHVVRRARARACRGQQAAGEATRLVTLLGAGGIGKTRLSLQAAAGLMDDYPDGVWLVELAPLADARLVPQAVASVAGRQGGGGASGRRGAGRGSCKDRQLLLVLDNCEHLVQACAELATDCCRRVRSSRSWRPAASRCTSRGETTYPGAGAGGPRSAPSDHARGTLDAIRGGAPVRRPRDRGAARVRGDRRERAGGRRNLSAPRRHSARASSSPRRACARCRSSRSRRG